jgi:hypothetical protein
MQTELVFELQHLQQYTFAEITNEIQYFSTLDELVSKINNQETRRRVLYGICLTFSMLYLRPRPKKHISHCKLGLSEWMSLLKLEKRADGYVKFLLFLKIISRLVFQDDNQNEPLLLLYQCATQSAFQDWVQARIKLCINQYADQFIKKSANVYLCWNNIRDSYNYTRRLLDELHAKCKINLQGTIFEKSFLHGILLLKKKVINVRSTLIQSLPNHHQPLPLQQVKQLFKAQFTLLKQAKQDDKPLFHLARTWMILLLGFISAFRKIDMQTCKITLLPEQLHQYKTVFKGGLEKTCHLAYLFTQMNGLEKKGWKWYRDWLAWYLELRRDYCREECQCLLVCSKEKYEKGQLCSGKTCQGMSKSLIRDCIAQATQISETHTMKTTSVNWIRKLSHDPKIWSFHAHHNQVNTTLNFYADALFQEKKESIEQFLIGLIQYYQVGKL